LGVESAQDITQRGGGGRRHWCIRQKGRGEVKKKGPEVEGRGYTKGGEVNLERVRHLKTTYRREVLILEKGPRKGPLRTTQRVKELLVKAPVCILPKGNALGGVLINSGGRVVEKGESQSRDYKKGLG